MFKLCVFVALLAYASAGLIPLDDGHGLGGLTLGSSLGGLALGPSLGGLALGPSLGGLTLGSSLGGLSLGHNVAIAAPATVAVKAGATSYQNNNLLSLNPTAVVTKTIAPAPIITKVAAPIALASPLAHTIQSPLGVLSLGNLGLGHL